MSSNVIDEMTVKVGVDSSEYDQQVEKLTESNDKLAEGLEDTEKQFDKTTKSSRENSKEVKNTNDEYQKFTTSLNTALSKLSRITGAALASGAGLVMLAADTASANNNLRQMSENVNEAPNSFKRLGYAINEVGGNAQAAIKSAMDLKGALVSGDLTGQQGAVKLFTELDVATRDAKTGKIRPVEDILRDSAYAMEGRDRADLWQMVQETGSFNEDIFNAMSLGGGKFGNLLSKQNSHFMPDQRDYENYREFEGVLGDIENKFISIKEMLSSEFIPELTKLGGVFSNWLGTLEDDPEKAKEVVAAGSYGAAALLAMKFLNVNPIVVASPLLMSGTDADRALSDRDKHKKFNETEVAEFEKEYGEGAFSKAKSKYSPIIAPSYEGTEGLLDIWRSYMDRYREDQEKRDEMERAYGGELAQKAYDANSGAFFQLFTKNDWREADPEKVQKYIQDYAEKNGIEIEAGNTLIKETNSILKRQDTSNSIKNIEANIEKIINSSDFNEDYGDLQGLGGEDLWKGIMMQNQKIDAQSGNKEEDALSYFMGKGWSRSQAVGIVANLKAESGLNERAINPNEKDSRGNKFSSHGLAQWNRGRLDNFKSIIGKDIAKSTFQEQLSFIQWELENTHKRAGRSLKSADNINDATAAITRHYEVPADMENTIRKRQRIANGMQGGRDVEAYTDNSLQMMQSLYGIDPNGGQASNSSVDVTIGDVVVQTAASSLSGVGQDMADAVKARMMLGQLTTGARV